MHVGDTFFCIINNFSIIIIIKSIEIKLVFFFIFFLQCALFASQFTETITLSLDNTGTTVGFDAR